MTSDTRSYQDRSESDSNKQRGEASRVPGDAGIVKSVETKRGRGRPAGSKNKPKALIPKELAKEFLGVVKDILPPEHYEEMRRAIVDGKSISVLSEAKITLKLMSPAIWQRLIAEGKPQPTTPAGIDSDMIEEIGGVERPTGFSRDLNERMKIYMGLLDFIDKSERRNDEAASGSKKPILEVFARSGIDGDRLRVLVGVESGGMGRDADKDVGQAVEAGTIPDQLPQRSIVIPHNAEGPSVGDIDDDIRGDSARSVHAE